MANTLNWLDRLRAEAKRTDITQAGKSIGYSRTAVSLALAGKYPGGTAKLERAVLNRLSNQVACPYQGVAITKSDCEALHTAAMPTSTPSALRQWRACQGCPNNSAKEKADAA